MSGEASGVTVPSTTTHTIIRGGKRIIIIMIGQRKQLDILDNVCTPLLLINSVYACTCVCVCVCVGYPHIAQKCLGGKFEGGTAAVK